MNDEPVLLVRRLCKLLSLALSHWSIYQAGDRIRTGDVQLGKLTFYH